MSQEFSGMEAENKYGNIKLLTVLTFVGSGLGIVSSIVNYVRSAKNVHDMEEMVNKPEFEKMPDFVKKMYSPEAIELIRKMDVNKLPIFIISLIGCVLCIYGALEMRKLKLSGFYTYIIGSVVPYIGMVIFLGTSFLTGWGTYAGLGITAIFIILYGLQTKFLVNK